MELLDELNDEGKNHHYINTRFNLQHQWADRSISSIKEKFFRSEWPKHIFAEEK